MAATSTLPPVRTSNYLPQALAPSISEETISLWLKLGAMEKLEQAVLDGYGDLLIGRTARLPQVNKFLRQVPMFQNKIYEIHNAVSKGKLRELQHLVDRKKLASCRDHIGATPLHKAVIFGHKDIILYLLDRYDATLHIRDHQGRTPLHYAAFLSDGGEIYQMLIDAGADVKAIDAYGNIPEYYMKMQDEAALQELREGYLNNDIRKIKPKKSNPLMKPQKGYSKSTVGRVQIKELINKGNLEALEDIILRGHGGLLLGETSSNPTIQDFLTMVPFYLKRIHDVHRAAMRGRLQEIAKLLDHKSFAIATDQLGATPLHKAVWYENYDIAEYIVNNFPLSLNIADMDGRTPLHYAAALRDNKEMYNILLNAGASKSIQDIKGKTSDFYLQHPELLKIDEVIRRNQRINATHMANIINHTRSKLPLRHTPPIGKDGFSSSSTSEKSGQEIDDEMPDLRNEDKDSEERQHTPSNLFDSKTESLIKSLPPLPPLKLQRLDITSANIRKWITEEDIDKLKQAVIDGYGEMISRENSENKTVQEYISHSLPTTMNKIHAIHNAVSHDDLTELKTLSMDNEELVFAKDNFGMTSLHKAVILGHTKIVKFLIDNFPEIINITDKDGRTALHYATAASRKESINIYRILIQAGADPKIRDMQGRTADYYRTHRMATTLKSPLKPKTSSNTMQNQSESSRFTKQGVLEKITSILQKGDVEMLKEIVLEGYGKHLLGRTSWNEETRQYLKTVPQYLSTIRSLQEAVIAGDINTVGKRINDDEKLLKSKDETGLTPIHLAIIHNKPEVVSYLTKHYPAVLNLKDINGRTPLHLAAQENYVDLYKIMKDNGADPMILDQKGRTAEYYLTISDREDERLSRTSLSSENVKVIANEELEKDRETNIDDAKEEDKEANNKSEETVLNNNTDNSTSEQNNFEEDKKIINSESKDLVNENNVKEPLPVESTEKFNSNEAIETINEKTESNSKQISNENENVNEKKSDLEKTEEKNNSSNEDEQKREDNNNINNNNNSEGKEDINNLDAKSIDTKNSEEIMNTEHSEQNAQQEEEKIVNLIPEKVPNAEEDKNSVEKEINNDEKENNNQQESEKNEQNNESNTSEKYSESALEDSKSINTEDINSENKNDKVVALKNNNNNEETIKTNTVESTELSDNTDINSEITKTNEENNKQEILENSNNEQNGTELQNTHFTEDSQDDNIENNEKNEEVKNDEKNEEGKNNEKNEEEKNNEKNEEEKNNEKNEEEKNNLKNEEEKNNEENEEEKNNEENEEEKNNEKNEEEKNNEKDGEGEKDKETNEKDNAISKEEKHLPQNIEENVANAKEKENLIQNAEQNEDSTKEENNLTENIDQIKANNTEEEDSIQNAEQNNIKEETNTIIENNLKENEEDNEQNSTKEINDQELTKETDEEKDSLKNANVALETDNPNDSKLNQHENDTEVNVHNNAETKTDDHHKLTNKNLELDIKENNSETQDTEHNINEPQTLESSIISEKDKETNIDDANKNNTMSSDDLNSEIHKNNIQKESNENKNNFSNRIKNNSGIKSRNSGSRNSSQKDYLDDLIEQWIREGDLLRLEHVVLAGQGDRLIEKTSDDKQVQDFLDLVPIYTAKIRAIHEAVIRGNLREVRAVLTRKRFALSRDHVGASPLHLAVLHRHADIVQYIISHFPETMDGPDNEGRTPLHYSAVIPDEGYLYKIIKTQGADENIKDKMGITPRYYLENGGQLTVQDLWDSYKSGEEQ